MSNKIKKKPQTKIVSLQKNVVKKAVSGAYSENIPTEIQAAIKRVNHEVAAIIMQEDAKIHQKMVESQQIDAKIPQLRKNFLDAEKARMLAEIAFWKATAFENEAKSCSPT